MAWAGPRITSWRWLGATGFAFGLVTAIFSVVLSRGTIGLPLFSVFAAGPAFAVGAWLADRIWVVVIEPTRRRVVTFAIIAGLCAPALTGALDLYLRASTP